MHSIRHHPASVGTPIRQFGRGATGHGSDQDAAHSGGSRACSKRRSVVVNHAPRTPLSGGINPGITGDTMMCVAMTLRLADDETDALRRRADLEHRSMQEIARQAIREYVENHSRADLLDQVLDEELPRYAEALERLGQ
jgi:hypothetical protein